MYRSHVDVFNYRGWRPFRGALFIAAGILVGYLVAAAHQPAGFHQLPTPIDCPR
jgi:hypothetical protein